LIRRPVASASTTSSLAGKARPAADGARPPAGARPATVGSRTPTVTTPGQTRTETMADPTGKPPRSVVHMGRPLRAAGAETAVPDPPGAPWPSSAAYACPRAGVVPSSPFGATPGPGSSRAQRTVPARPQPAPAGPAGNAPPHACDRDPAAGPGATA